MQIRMPRAPLILTSCCSMNTPLNTKFWDYAFVVVPLAELIPDFEHPIRQEKLSRVAEQVRGQVWIVKRDDVSL